MCIRDREHAALVAENEKLRELLTTNPGELIGNCSPMLQVYDQIRQVAPSDDTVLIDVYKRQP